MSQKGSEESSFGQECATHQHKFVDALLGNKRDVNLRSKCVQPSVRQCKVRIVHHGWLRRDMPLPASRVAAVGHGTTADQGCRVTHVGERSDKVIHQRV